ncbi:MAG: nucleoside deaminase [Nanoarchaeota archaeon]|nr:nucleoside deaminase [Nanoarchaeota archaeon]
MAFTADDKKFMKLALEEARKAYSNGDYPVGAVLVIDGKFVDSGRNALYSNKNWVSHAELRLLNANANIIREKRKNNSKVELYTTLEPCLMCMGTAVLNRISRIVVACPDPHGGAAHLDPKHLTSFYVRKWPKIDSGLFKEESYQMLVDFMRQNPAWVKVLKTFEKAEKKL